MGNWLKKLNIDELSLVDSGANRGAVSVLMKRAGENSVELVKKVLTALGVKPEEVTKILSGGESMPIQEEIVKELQTKMEKMEKSMTLSTAIGAASIAISKANSKTDLEKVKEDISKLDQTDARVTVLNDMVEAGLKKSAHHDAYSENLGGDEKKKFESMPMKEKDAYMAKNPASTGEGEEGEEEGEDEGVEKRLKEEITKRQNLEATVAKIEKREAINKLMTEDLKDMEGVAKLSTLAESIYKIRQGNSADADVVVAQLKALAAIAKKSPAFQEIGGGQAAEGNAQDKLDALALEKSKKENISKQKATSLILDTPEGKELYKQIDAESRAAQKNA